LTLARLAPMLRPLLRAGKQHPGNDAQAEVVVPKIRSSKKRMRQTRARTLRNRTKRSQLRTAIKRVRAAGSSAEAATAFGEAVSLLDRAGRKHLIHPNTAARHKSRLAKAVAAKKQ
jgi:small subunit ribosomal protein S20